MTQNMIWKGFVEWFIIRGVKMNCKLHNKLEVIQGGKTIVAYNSMLETVYSAIANLKDYFKYIVVGTGTTETTFTMTKLASYSGGGYLLTTDAVSADINADELYVKKSFTFGENDYSGLTFSEIGITDDSASNPDIYNRILLKDSSGNALTVTKRDGESLTLRMTVYLEIDTDSKHYFTLGENALIKQLMGEHVADNKNLFAIRGSNTSDNSQSIDRLLPLGGQSKCAATVEGSASENTFKVNFVANLGNGAAREIVFIYANTVVARVNIEDKAVIYRGAQAITSDYMGFVDFGENFNNFESLSASNAQKNVTENDFKMSKYTRSLGEQIKKVPDFKHFKLKENSKLLMSPDGKSFVLGLENNIQYGIYKVMPSGGIVEICDNAYNDDECRTARFYDCEMYYFTTIINKFSHYVVENGVLVSKPIENNKISLIYDLSKLKDFDVSIATNGHLLIGMIIESNNKQIGSVIALEKDEATGGYKYLSHKEATIENVDKMVSCPKECHGDGGFLFFSQSTTKTESGKAIEYVTETSTKIIENDQFVNLVHLPNCFKVLCAKDFLICLIQGTAANRVMIYDIVNDKHTNIGANTVNDNIYGNEGNDKYFVQNDPDGNFDALMYRVKYHELKPFEDTLPFDKSNVLKAFFAKDVVVFIVKMASGDIVMRAYTLDETYLYGVNFDCPNEIYFGDIYYKKYIGTDEYQGVQAKLTIKIDGPTVEGNT